MNTAYRGKNPWAWEASPPHPTQPPGGHLLSGAEKQMGPALGWPKPPQRGECRQAVRLRENTPGTRAGGQNAVFPQPAIRGTQQMDLPLLPGNIWFLVPHQLTEEDCEEGLGIRQTKEKGREGQGSQARKLSTDFLRSLQRP